VTMRLSCMAMEIWSLKDFGVMTVTLWGHLTVIGTMPSDSKKKHVCVYCCGVLSECVDGSGTSGCGVDVT